MSSKAMRDFQKCLSTAGIYDLSFCGNSFTWINNQERTPVAKKTRHNPHQ